MGNKGSISRLVDTNSIFQTNNCTLRAKGFKFRDSFDGLLIAFRNRESHRAKFTKFN